MKKGIKKIAVGALSGAIIAGGISLIQASPLNNRTMLYNVEKTTYSRTIDEEGNMSFKEVGPESEYLSLEEIVEIPYLEINSKSEWTKVEPDITCDYGRLNTTVRYSEEELDSDFVEDLASAFKQGEIDYLSRDKLIDYCREHAPQMTAVFYQTKNWGTIGEYVTESNLKREEPAGSSMTIATVDYDKTTLKPISFTEQVEKYTPVAVTTIMGATIGAVVVATKDFVDGESKPSVKSKKR